MYTCITINNRYSKVLPFSNAIELSQLEDQFLQYQLLDHNDVPEIIWNAAKVIEQDERSYYRMDTIWDYLRTARSADGTLAFDKLAKVALLVLVLPHSNAEEERVFSLVTKNKTKFRPSLKLDGTLSSILTIKLANSDPCHKYEPPQQILDTAKKATVKYNKSHDSKK